MFNLYTCLSNWMIQSRSHQNENNGILDRCQQNQAPLSRYALSSQSLILKQHNPTDNDTRAHPSLCLLQEKSPCIKEGQELSVSMLREHDAGGLIGNICWRYLLLAELDQRYLLLAGRLDWKYLLDPR